MRDSAAEAVRALTELGLRPVMLTGDSRATAERIAAELGIDEVIAEVLSADKAAKVAELQSEGRKVAMVGDGVNDAPAGAGGRRNHHRRGDRRGRRDGRRGADALGPAGRVDRHCNQPRHAAKDASEPRLGGRLQLARATHRSGRLRAARAHAAPRDSRADECPARASSSPSMPSRSSGYAWARAAEARAPTTIADTPLPRANPPGRRRSDEKGGPPHTLWKKLRP